MFGWFRKRKKKEDVGHHDDAFGNVVFYGWWMTEEKTSFPLFGSELETRLMAGASDRNTEINDEQKEACRYFRNNLDALTYEAGSVLEEFLKGKTQLEILGMIESFSIYFSRSGEIGIYIKSNLDVEELDKYGIGPEDDFGIVLRPEKGVISSGDEFLDRFAF